MKNESLARNKFKWNVKSHQNLHKVPQNWDVTYDQLGAAANFDDLVKFGDRRQIRRSQMFIKLAFEFGCDLNLMSHPITRSLASKLR